MPRSNEWIDNEVALEHKGVTIYHVYKNDDGDCGARTYCFGMTPLATDVGEDDGEFDVRELKEWKDNPSRSCQSEIHILTILRLAINHGTIKPWED
jgi:hypothetical protein